ncbi:hypothetical protein Rhopal_002269-T1 [Rhodotorula paludigena]|uniref:DUF1899 domain-containing protein n=1 Tax=Rhodotorula paludigena TaxID=86838 RepID=A0AAV5GFH7_9BASI|nr:hypothetical protein Rhopal_002269-T1 [Rhodotorula paludigena]
MPPRFFTSPYKNILATPAKREGWYSELPVTNSAASDASEVIATTGAYWIAQGSASGSLVCVPWDREPGKFGTKAPALQTGLRVSTLATDDFDELLAVGGDNGTLNVYTLPPASTFADSAAPHSPSPVFSASASPAGKPVDVLSFHPLASSLLLAASATTLSIFDASSSSSAAAHAITLPSPVWSAQWSADGRSVSATTRDGHLRLYDVRSPSSAQPALDVVAHAGLNKPSRHIHLSHLGGGAQQVLTTGFSRMREREYALFDLRNTSTSSGALKMQRIDTNTGVLEPLLDRERGIVYLAGRGDMTLRWVEVPASSPAGSFNEGAAPLPVPVLGAALAPPRCWDLMKTEVGRLVVLGAGGADAVVPVQVTVPRRQYLDFHADLYPPVSARVPAQSAADWLAASPEDVRFLEQRQLDPTKPWPAKDASASSADSKPSASSSAVKAPAPVPTTQAKAEPTVQTTEKSSPVPVVPADTPKPAEAPAPPAAEAAAPTPPIATPSPSSASAAPSATASTGRPTFGSKPASPAPVAAAVPTAQLSDLSLDKAPAASSPVAPPTTSAPVAAAAPSTPPTTLGAFVPAGEPFNPGWSRKFLAGTTPLKPEFYDVHDLSSTMGNDVQLLKASPTYLFYPLAGPGGRIAYHPLSRPGRLPVHPSTLAIGGTVVEFAVDPFDGGSRAFVAGDDGAVRVFELPRETQGWTEGEERNEAARVLTDPKMDRISELLPHPAAKDLLLTVSDDRGNPTARLWNVATGELLLQAELPKGGVSSAAWSPDGSLLAVATKNKQVHVLDPRKPADTLVSTASHDSVRPVRLAWASESHLVSTGFNRAASRELALYNLDGASKQLSQLGKTSLDVSPAPLFPFVDLDTHIVLLYSRGDRSCLAYELNFSPPSPYDAFAKLPTFEHASLQSGFAFLPKTRNNVKAVEIVRALRLTPSTIEIVSFGVPRAKAEFFQDDIFVPTRNVEKPSMTAAEYVAGANKPLEMVDLRPEGMKPLSEAPAPAKKVNTRSLIKQDGLTDIEREQQHLDQLFQSAKAEGGADAASDDDDVPAVRNKHTPADDDDW